MFKQRVDVLKKYLAAAGRDYADCQFTAGHTGRHITVNERPYRHGPSPGEIQAVADQLRTALVRLFGEEARHWTSKFLSTPGFDCYAMFAPVIKDSFDWASRPRDEVAKEYQAIVSPLYQICAAPLEHSTDYQAQLRRAFDREEVEDYRTPQLRADYRYLVLTGKEADERVSQIILDSIWSLDPTFLSAQLSISVMVILKLQELGGHSKEAFLAILGSRKQDFVAAVLQGKGRGYFLANDRKETAAGGGWYLYCLENNVEA